MRAVVLAGSFVLAVAGGNAVAGTIITLELSVGSEPVTQQTTEIGSKSLRVSAPHMQTIFRGDQNRVWMVSPEHKGYTEVTSEGLAQIKATTEQLAAHWRQMMASLPPEQRKKAEAMMAYRGMGSGDGSAPPPTVYEKAGPPIKIGDYTCSPFRVTGGGAPPSDSCMAALSDLDLTRDDLKPFIDFGKFMSQAHGGLGGSIHPR